MTNTVTVLNIIISHKKQSNIIFVLLDVKTHNQKHMQTEQCRKTEKSYETVGEEGRVILTCGVWRDHMGQQTRWEEM